MSPVTGAGDSCHGQKSTRRTSLSLGPHPVGPTIMRAPLWSDEELNTGVVRLFVATMTTSARRFSSPYNSVPIPREPLHE